MPPRPKTLRAMPWPMSPTPINPTFMSVLLKGARPGPTATDL